MSNEYNEFKELIQDMVQQEINNSLKNEYLFRGITGTVLKVNEDQTCTVDIVSTVLNNVKNKSNEIIQEKDTVTILERIGSNYSNCFIFIKNG